MKKNLLIIYNSLEIFSRLPKFDKEKRETLRVGTSTNFEKQKSLMARYLNGKFSIV